VVDELVTRDLGVEFAERPGEPGARRRERLEAEGGEHTCRADVPRVGHQEELLSGMQLRKATAACG
jgi:hypothetical protein